MASSAAESEANGQPKIGSQLCSASCPLSETQPMLSEEEPSTLAPESMTESEVPPPPPAPPAAPASTTIPSKNEETFRKLASDLATAYPNIPAEKFLRRALALSKSTDVWIGEESQFFKSLVDDYTDRALESVTEHKELEDEVTELTREITAAGFGIAERFRRLKKLMLFIEKIRFARSKIDANTEALEDIRSKIHTLTVMSSNESTERVVAGVKNLINAQ